MISIKLLNDKIKSKEFLMTTHLIIERKLNKDLIAIIMNHTGFAKIPKEELKKMFGLISLISNRIYYMYNNEIKDWMNYYNHNSNQVITWNKNKFNIDKLNDIYFIIIELIRNHFKFDITIINNNGLFRLNDRYLSISLIKPKNDSIFISIQLL